MKRPTVLAQRNYQKARREMIEREDLKEKFAYIFQTNLWGADDTRSGLGSSLDATSQVRAAIEEVCTQYKVKKLLDIPCGDAAWILHARLPIREYIGGDIVPEIIERNRSARLPPGVKYGVRFEVMDLIRDRLPDVDIVLCRDCLVHLSFAKAQSALRNIVRSAARYLLTTTFTDHDVNEDIEDGDWRLLNLERSPFFLPKPLAIFNERCEEEDGAFADKSLGLWTVSELSLPA